MIFPRERRCKRQQCTCNTNLRAGLSPRLRSGELDLSHVEETGGFRVLRFRLHQNTVTVVLPTVLLMIATVADDELQVTTVVKSCAVPSV